MRHLFAGLHNSAQYIFEYFSVCMMFYKKCSPSRSFCHLHLSMLGVDRRSKHRTLFKCLKSQTECLEYSKTPDRQSRTPSLLSVLRTRASALQASRLSGSTTSCWVIKPLHHHFRLFISSWHAQLDLHRHSSERTLANEQSVSQKYEQ